MRCEHAKSVGVTVVMPFLDPPSEFFRQAVASVRAQTYPDWELLLVNDGSGSESAALAAELAASDPARIRCLSHQEGRTLGSSGSRNLGVRNARGDYVAFLDADDVWLERKLEEQLHLFSLWPAAGMIFGNTLYWYGWTGSRSDLARDFEPRLGIEAAQPLPPPAMLRYALQGRAAVPCMCSVIVRRNALEDEDWFDDRFAGMYDDQVFYAKLWLVTPVLVSSRCWDRYRQHPRSMTAGGDRSKRHLEARISYLDRLSKYLENRGETDHGLWRALATEKRLARVQWLGSVARKVRRLGWRLLPPVTSS